MYVSRWRNLAAFKKRNVRNTQSTSEMNSAENDQYELNGSRNNDYDNDNDKNINNNTRLGPRRSTFIGVPSSLINVPSKRNSFVQSTGFIYNGEVCQEVSYQSAEEIPIVEADHCLWIDIPQVNDHELISGFSQRFKIHSLVEADIETTEQRTKMDVLEDALFLVCKLIYPDHISHGTRVEQISFYMKKNVLLTFRETSTEIFEPVKNRIRQNKGRIRKSNIDYLFYSLMDRIVDRYMDVLERIGSSLESIDHQLMANVSRDTLEKIYDFKREMLYYRRTIVPLKEIITKLQKEEETLIMQESTTIYLKDLFDHVVQVNDTIDAYREMLASFIDLYMMLNSNEMDKVMKTLTMMSTIFIPLTFIVGLYGMNFDFMPELHWRYGYFVTLGAMGALVILMLVWFKRKKWF